MAILEFVTREEFDQLLDRFDGLLERFKQLELSYHDLVSRPKAQEPLPPVPPLEDKNRLHPGSVGALHRRLGD